MGWTLAVDFGTTATAAAVHDGDTELLEIDGASRLPSLVLLGADGDFVVGTAAGRQAASTPDRVERSPKRRLGDPVIVLGDQPVAPAALVAAVLRHVAAEAIRHQGGTKPDHVVLTHPVTWVGARLGALREAARLADLGEVTLMSEPVAAALHLGDDRVSIGDHVAVYDLGGGTFDAAVLRRTPTGFESVGVPGGDDQLGGEDFDEALYEEVGVRIAEQAPDAWRQLRSSDERSWVRANLALRDEVRAAKEALSSSPEYTVYIGAPADLEVTITRERLEELVREPLERTVDELVATIERSGLTVADLAAIHLVGGSSRIPLVTRLLSERTGLVPTTWGDPKAAVALGAAAKMGAPSPVVLAAPPDPTVVTPAADPTAIVPAAVAPASSATDGPGRKRPKALLAGAVAAALLLIVAVLVFSGGGSDDDPVAAGDTDTTTSTIDEDEDDDTSPTDDLVVEFAAVDADGVSTTRSWSLDPNTDVLTNTVSIGNSGTEPIERSHIEVIPKEVAADVADVEFSPAYSEVLHADPVVRYDLTIEPGEPAVLAWSAKVADDLDQVGLDQLSEARNAAEADIYSQLAALGGGEGVDPGELVLGPIDTGGGGTTQTTVGGSTGTTTGGTTATTTGGGGTGTTTVTASISKPGAVGSFLASDPVAVRVTNENDLDLQVKLTWSAPGDNGGQSPTIYRIRCTIMNGSSAAGSCGQSTASGTATTTTSPQVKKQNPAASWLKWEIAAENSKGVGPYTAAQASVPSVVGELSWVGAGKLRTVGLRTSYFTPSACTHGNDRICSQNPGPSNGAIPSGSVVALTENN